MEEFRVEFDPDPDPYKLLRDPDPGGTKIKDPTGPDPKHWAKFSESFAALPLFEIFSQALMKVQKRVGDGDS